MHRQLLLSDLNSYEQLRRLWKFHPVSGPGASTHPDEHDEHEQNQALTSMRQFASTHLDCFERSCLPGHFTGSALVVSQDLQQVLLTLHAKLGKWLQLGGHADGDSDLASTAYREACEESGLSQLSFLNHVPMLTAPIGKLPLLAYPVVKQAELEEPASPYLLRPVPFDLDIHLIPERKGAPSHLHYDLRYLIVADPAQLITPSNESKDLRWFDLQEACGVTSEPSMLRQFAKLRWLRSRLTLAPSDLD